MFIQLPASQLVQLGEGQPLELEVQLIANPPATIRFYYKNFELRNSPPTIEIDDQSVNYSSLIHRQPQSGLYRVVAMNEHGMAGRLFWFFQGQPFEDKFLLFSL